MKMFYCKEFYVMMLPTACEYRKNLATKYKDKDMIHNEKFGKHLAIEMMIDKCLPCKIGDKNNT